MKRSVGSINWAGNLLCTSFKKSVAAPSTIYLIFSCILSMEIPNDIIHAIVNQVGDAKDVLTLSSCNATSRAFRLYAQRHLFNSITIVVNTTDASRMIRLERLRDIFLASPSTPLLVKQLHLGFEAGRNWASPTQGLLLDMIPNVEQLFLESVETWGDNLWMAVPIWDDFGIGLRKAIERILRLDSLFHLQIREIDRFPLNMLHVCRANMRSFNFRLGSPNEKEMFPIEEGSWLNAPDSSLDSCVLRADIGRDLHPLVKSLIRYPVSRLRKFQVVSMQCDSLDMGLLQNVIDHVSPNLNFFGLRVDELTPISIARATRIKKLSLGQYSRPLTEAINWIFTVLSTAQTFESLEMLQLQLGVVDPSGDIQCLARLSAELASSQRLSNCLIHLYMRAPRPHNLEDALVVHMKEIVRRPRTIIYDGESMVDLDSLCARIDEGLAS